MDVVLNHYFHDFKASSLSHCVLIALSRCKFHKNEFFNAFLHLPHTCRFETRPNPPSKIARNAGGAHYLQFYRKNKHSDPYVSSLF